MLAAVSGKAGSIIPYVYKYVIMHIYFNIYIYIYIYICFNTFSVDLPAC